MKARDAAEELYERARRDHEREAAKEQRANHPLTARRHLAALKRLRWHGVRELNAPRFRDSRRIELPEPLPEIDPVDGGRNER